MAYDIVKELRAFHDCADGDVSGGNGHFRLQCTSDADQQRLNLRAVLREAAARLEELETGLPSEDELAEFIQSSCDNIGPARLVRTMFEKYPALRGRAGD
jgi:hypothetical protein